MRVSRVLRTYTAPASSHDYCLNLVREVDYDQFMLNLMQPQSIRLAHSAMRAFNVELGKGIEAQRFLAAGKSCRLQH